ncbi:hypothetical protein CCACVL1_05892 [Corchorus capsularis]|uniref:Uncharacterized protein n=1 Tax=Corchorus capsularis TaxID=210143 RepID=A0A1R3JIP3_COCAP|nr:hypothetical protein CCACVL1_05892 [Corchorus capsularis]
MGSIGWLKTEIEGTKDSFRNLSGADLEILSSVYGRNCSDNGGSTDLTLSGCVKTGQICPHQQCVKETRSDTLT